jgi:hypothetical protein
VNARRRVSNDRMRRHGNELRRDIMTAPRRSSDVVVLYVSDYPVSGGKGEEKRKRGEGWFLGVTTSTYRATR